jgi:hypothetical protein
MSLEKKRPAGLAQRLAEKRRSVTTQRTSSDLWRRETFTLPRLEARAKAREWFDLYPKAAYMTEIEFWRELSDGQIEFTIRRLPSAD